GLSAGDFSYNTGSLRCPRCQGTGEITLDVQFLPDVDIPCTECNGRRYSPDADAYRRPSATGEGVLTLQVLLELTLAEAIPHVSDILNVRYLYAALRDFVLGYLMLI